MLQSNFTANNGSFDINQFVLAPNGVIDSGCASRQSMHFSGTTGAQILTTQDVNMTGRGIVQFDLNLGCRSVSAAWSVVLEQSTNLGTSFSIVLPLCNILSTGSCSSTWLSTGESRYFSTDLNGQWRRFVIQVNVTGLVRYRWRLERQLPSYLGAEWGVTNIYIGSGCNNGCSGRGSCFGGTCVCDSGSVFNGTTCVVDSPTLTQFRETFETSLNSANWVQSSGGSPGSSPCGTLAAAQSMFFNGASGPRRMITNDINTTNADILSFYLQLGYSSSILGSVASTCYTPASSAVSVTLSYSTDAGLTYTLLALYQTVVSFAGPTVLTYYLPSEAKSSGTRFHWWQPSSGSSIDVWVRCVM
jgi:hypothetical protein